MKIVLLNPSLICGGSERVVTLLANYCQKNHQVTIITTDREEEPYFALSDKVERIGVLRGMSRSPWLSPFRKLGALRRIRKEVSERNPDLVITFQEKSSLYVLMALFGKKITKVVGVRNHPEYKKLSFLFSLLRRILYPSANAIVLQTEGIKDWYVKKGFKKEKLKVIINPLELNESPKQKVEKTILACGRLEPQKGFHELILMFAEINSEYPDWNLSIIGDGSERERLERLILDKNLESKVKLLGFQKDPVSYYEQGGVFAFSSHYEGFPNALCEAMASGMAVVSFDCPSGPSDLIKDSQNGFLVKAGDLETFKKRLAELISDRDLREKLGAEACKVKESLSIENVAKQWLEVT